MSRPKPGRKRRRRERRAAARYGLTIEQYRNGPTRGTGDGGFSRHEAWSRYGNEGGR